jgi:hypothetical protein
VLLKGSDGRALNYLLENEESIMSALPQGSFDEFQRLVKGYEFEAALGLLGGGMHRRSIVPGEGS